MPRRCEDRKFSVWLARLDGERRSVFDEVRLELPLNVTWDEVTEETRRTGDSELIELNRNWASVKNEVVWEWFRTERAI